MPTFSVQGIEFPVVDWSSSEATAGAEGLTDTQDMWRSSVGPTIEGHSVSLRISTEEEARAMSLWLAGGGEVWSDSDYGSHGTLLENPMATHDGSSHKFGTHYFSPPSAPDDLVSLTDVYGVIIEEGWTVMMHYDDGGGYDHYGLTSDGLKWTNGSVDQSLSLPFSVDSTWMVSLDSAGEYDDIVVLPFAIPQAWLSSLDTTTKFGRLPEINVSGDVMLDAGIIVAASEAALSPVATVDGTKWKVTVELVDYVPGDDVLNPADMSDVGLWYDAQDLTTLWQNTGRTTAVTADGQTVQAWDDKSGNARHMTNAHSSCTYSAAEIKGLPGVVFANGVYFGFQSGAFTHGTTNGSSLFFVMQNNDTAARTAYAFIWSSGGGVRVYFSHDASTGTGPGVNDGADKNFGLAAAIADEDVFSVIYETGGTARLRQGHDELGSIAYTTWADASQIHGLGGQDNDWSLGEYIYINREVTADERSGLTNYLRQRWRR